MATGDRIQDDLGRALEKLDPLASFAEVAQPTTEPPAWPEGMPQPGIYPDVPYDVYAGWKAVNASALKIGATVTALHMRAKIDGLLEKDTPDRMIGRAFHCAILEPDSFEGRFPVAGVCPEPLQSGKRKGQPCGSSGSFRSDSGDWYCGVHAKAHPEAVEPEEFLTDEEHGRIVAMRKNVMAHKVVKMLRQQGGCEVSLVWERDGIACKARADKLILDRACPDTIIDAKKIQPMAGTEGALQAAIRNYGYDLSAWWYVDGVHRLRPDKKRPMFAWVFCEDNYPFDVRPLWASKAMLEVGRIKAERAFTSYCWCLRSGTWPGYSEDIEEIMPSDFELKRYGLGG